MPIVQDFSLSKKSRLKGTKKIEYLFRTGKRTRVQSILMSYVLSTPTLPEKQCQVAVGFGASKKSNPKAVDRNYLKRILRESYRLQKSSIETLSIEKEKQLLVFFLLDTPRSQLNYELVFQSMRLCLNRLKTQFS